MEQNTRKIELEVLYKGKNISDYINKDLLNFSIEDSASNESDVISIKLQDIKQNWLKHWIVANGDNINVKANSYNWNFAGEKYSINFGDFYVDEPTYTFKPNTFELKANAIIANTNFRDLQRTKIWKGATVSGIAQTMAQNNGLSLVFDSKNNPKIKEKEQSQETDLEFLKSVCSENGLALKVYCSKIVIFDEALYESKPPKLTITPSDMLEGATFKKSLTDTGYDKVVLQYQKGEKKGTINVSFTRPNAAGSKTLYINDSVETAAEGLKRCQTVLREKNKKEITGSFSIPGLVRLYSAETIEIKDAGQFDGVYYIDSKSQSFSPTVASFEVHKILGY